jgi:hypothetical protein
MSLVQHVREALERRGLPQAAVNRDGYRVDEAESDLAIVRWGRGQPFRGRMIVPDGPELALCMRALKQEGFLVAPNAFEDSDGLFIAVRSRTT